MGAVTVVLLVTSAASWIVCALLAWDRRMLRAVAREAYNRSESYRRQLEGVAQMAARDAAGLEKERRENVKLQNTIITMRPKGCPDHDR